MKQLQSRHRLAVRCFHWINFAVLAIMIWSGLLIYWANDVYRIGIGRFTLFKFFPESFYSALNISFRLAEGMSWHFTFMWLFAINGVLYVSYTIVSGEWHYHGLQRFAYITVILMGAGSVLTGLAIYKPAQLAWLTSLLGGYQFARLEHFWLTIGYVFFLAAHIVQVVRAGWNSFQSMITGSELVEVKRASGD
jgi:thiosulfate reductase cytochrome b subunit